VQDDEPTVPQLPRLAPSALSGREPRGQPSWPDNEPRLPRAFGEGISPMVLAAGLAVSLVANGALLVALVSVLLFARTGFFSPRGSSTTHTPASSATSATSAASPTSAASSPTSSESWLEVAPISVQLGCGEGQDTQFVVLENTGPGDVQWQAQFSVSPDQAGVEVDPSQGDLSAGASSAIQIRNTAQADARNGVILFAPDTSVAGAPPSLSYTTASCS
jgi:hypothetical protein